MTKIEYTQDAELTRRVQAIIDTSPSAAMNRVREQELKVIPVLKVRTNEDGEPEPNPGPPVKLQKVNDLWRVFTEAHYLLVVDYSFFNTPSNKHEPILFNALCGIDVKIKDGNIKLGTRKPDLNYFSDTVELYGAFERPLVVVNEWMNAVKKQAATDFTAKVSTGVLEEAHEVPAVSAESPVEPSEPVEEQPVLPPVRRSGRTKR